MPATPESQFNGSLLRWFRENKRPFPWRERADPYSIWVSEVMLQQTQAATALPFYNRWLQRFPTLRDAAAATDEEALALWQGLGYYRRCLNLVAGARLVEQGGWPNSFAEWRKIPGVGQYSAAALASICSGEPVGVVDGNVRRVYARLFDCDDEASMVHRRTWAWTQATISVDSPADWNQAVMELGATVCTRRAPKCNECPVRRWCKARASERVNHLPRPKPRKKPIELTFELCVPVMRGEFGLTQSGPTRWWQGLWQFPLAGSVRVPIRVRMPLNAVRHTVTHHRITMIPTICELATLDESLRWVDSNQLEDVPMPAPHRRIAEAAMKALSGA